MNAEQVLRVEQLPHKHVAVRDLLLAVQVDLQVFVWWRQSVNAEQVLRVEQLPHKHVAVRDLLLAVQVGLQVFGRGQDGCSVKKTQV